MVRREYNKFPSVLQSTVIGFSFVSDRRANAHGYVCVLKLACVRDGFESGGNRTTAFIHEREIVRDWSVGL